MTKAEKLSTLNNTGNGGKAVIDLCQPFTVRVTVQGSAPLLFHAWDCDSVAEASKASKGGKGKKTDDVDNYVYRDADGFISLPGEYLRQSVIHAAKYRQDPRSPRKSAMDLFKAGVVSLTEFASLGSKDWEYLDRRRVCIQRAGITRLRPAFSSGWMAVVDLLVLTPEYIGIDDLRATLEMAGRLIGVGEYRPTFGRYGIVGFEALT